VHPTSVVVGLEQCQFSFQILRLPIEQLARLLLPKCADGSFDKGMGNGNARHGLDGFNIQDAQVGLPTVEPKEGIVIEAEPKALALTGDGLVEQAAQSWAVHGQGLHRKTYDPAAERIHDRRNRLILGFIRLPLLVRQSAHQEARRDPAGKRVITSGNCVQRTARFDYRMSR
jgi:hypothetical protein